MRPHAIPRRYSVIAVVLAALSISSSLAAASMVVGAAQPPQPAKATRMLQASPAARAAPVPRIELGHFEGY